MIYPALYFKRESDQIYILGDILMQDVLVHMIEQYKQLRVLNDFSCDPIFNDDILELLEVSEIKYFYKGLIKEIDKHGHTLLAAAKNPICFTKTDLAKLLYFWMYGEMIGDTPFDLVITHFSYLSKVYCKDESVIKQFIIKQLQGVDLEYIDSIWDYCDKGVLIYNGMLHGGKRAYVYGDLEYEWEFDCDSISLKNAKLINAGELVSSDKEEITCPNDYIYACKDGMLWNIYGLDIKMLFEYFSLRNEIRYFECDGNSWCVEVCDFKLIMEEFQSSNEVLKCLKTNAISSGNISAHLIGMISDENEMKREDKREFMFFAHTNRLLREPDANIETLINISPTGWITAYMPQSQIVELICKHLKSKYDIYINTAEWGSKFDEGILIAVDSSARSVSGVFHGKINGADTEKSFETIVLNGERLV